MYNKQLLSKCILWKYIRHWLIFRTTGQILTGLSLIDDIKNNLVIFLNLFSATRYLRFFFVVKVQQYPWVTLRVSVSIQYNNIKYGTNSCCTDEKRTVLCDSCVGVLISCDGACYALSRVHSKLLMRRRCFTSRVYSNELFAALIALSHYFFVVISAMVVDYHRHLLHYRSLIIEIIWLTIIFVNVWCIFQFRSKEVKNLYKVQNCAIVQIFYYILKII